MEWTVGSLWMLPSCYVACRLVSVYFTLQGKLWLVKGKLELDASVREVQNKSLDTQVVCFEFAFLNVSFLKKITCFIFIYQVIYIFGGREMLVFHFI